jgi:pimeloyl-ACP methyl ester carboxylesterase
MGNASGFGASARWFDGYQGRLATCVEGAGHWLMEENPTATIALIEEFLTKSF